MGQISKKSHSRWERCAGEGYSYMNMANNPSGVIEALWGRVISDLRVGKGPSSEIANPEPNLKILIWLKIFSWCGTQDYGRNHIGG